MLQELRRIVTGHNADSRSVVVIDGPPARTAGTERGGLFELWNTDGAPVDSTDSVDRADGPVRLVPTSGGTKFRYFAVGPTPEGVTREQQEALMAEFFAEVGSAHHRVDTTRHPAMHKTPTVDYIILLKGDVTLLLEDDEVRLKPFDVVVQRGTNHAWVVNGDEPALFIAVLIDADIRE